MKSSPSLASRCARRSSRLAPLLLACACSDPHYVSLGWNESTERGEPTPGVGVPSEEPAGGVSDVDFIRPSEPSSRLACDVGAARVALPLACDARPLGACPELGTLPALTLSALLSSILRECGELDNEIAVQFDQSCAIAFELSSDSLSLAVSVPVAAPSPEPPAPDTMATDTPSETAALDAGVREVLAPDAAATARDAEELDTVASERAARRRCIADRLSARRFECARDTACSEGSSFPNPTR